MYHLSAIVLTTDELRFWRPKFPLVVNHTSDTQLLGYRVGYSKHNETEHEAFLAIAKNERTSRFSGVGKISSNNFHSTSLKPSKRPAISLSMSWRVNYHVLDISGIGSSNDAEWVTANKENGILTKTLLLV